jgi:DNA-directed RNA polymerase specialized sigma24 family protein
VHQLPGKYREVIALHYFSDLSLREAAVVLQVPLGTVKSRISRGIGQLQSMLAKDMPPKKKRSEL